MTARYFGAMTQKSGAPKDFGARLRAARGYMDVSQAGLAAALDTAGASESTIKGWESGSKQPNPLVMRSLAPMLAEASALPESFFWGEQDRPLDLEAQIIQLDEQVRQLRVETAARDAEVLRLLEVGSPPSQQSQRPPQP